MNGIETGGIVVLSMGLLEIIKLLVGRLQARNGNGKITRAQCLEAQAALKKELLATVATHLYRLEEVIHRVEGRVEALRLWQAAENARRRDDEER